MLRFFRSLFVGEEGATMAEYAIMLALLGAALITSVSALSSSISTKFTSVSNTLSGS